MNVVIDLTQQSTFGCMHDFDYKDMEEAPVGITDEDRMEFSEDF